MFGIEAKSVDPDQTAPLGPVLSMSTPFVKEASKHSADDMADNFCCDWCF